MLKELKFVQGAVAKKDFVPEMKHFAIEKGVVRSFNGVVALSSPIPFDIDCNPRADQLVKAISHCKETASLSMTATGRLRIVSGAFRAFVECVDGEMPHVEPEGDFVHVNGNEVQEAFAALEPFIGNDASRPWTNGVLLRGQSAYATNNVMLAQYWMGSPFPADVNIPKAAIAEVLRINEVCIGLQVTKTSLTFHFADKRWVRTALLSTEWPNLSPILDKPANLQPVNSSLFDALESLKPFADKLGRVFIYGNKAYTHVDAKGMPSSEDGAAYDIEGVQFAGIYRIEMLERLAELGEGLEADMSFYPEPCLFRNKRLRGAIIGMRA